MVSVCTVPARGGRSCEHFGGYKTINRIPLPLSLHIDTDNDASGSVHAVLKYKPKSSREIRHKVK